MGVVCLQESGPSLDRLGLPGWDRIDRLAAVLLETAGTGQLSLSHAQAARIRALWVGLEEADRRPIKFGGLPRATTVRGSFHRRYRTGGVVGVEAVGRYVTALNPIVSATQSISQLRNYGPWQCVHVDL